MNEIALSTAEQAWRLKFLKLFEVAPGGSWMSIYDALMGVVYRQDFEYKFYFSDQVLWLRRLCVERGLAREDRGNAPHVLEGYYGISRKISI
jgi:hypothetical protein